MTTRRLILINGPPSSGKDLSAIILRNMLIGKVDDKGEMFRPVIMKFADPLKAATHQLLCISHGCEYYEKEFGNEWKNKPQIEFYGKTPRSEYIAMSEEFLKPRHGEDVFGRLALRRIKLDKGHDTFIFSDSGFAEEAVPIITAVGIDNVCLIELSRSGCSYDGDSRGYIGNALQSQFPKLKRVQLPNNGDQAFLTMMLKGVMGKFMRYQAEF